MPDADNQRNGLRRWRKVAILLAMGALSVGLVFYSPLGTFVDREELLRFIQEISSRPEAPLVFMGMYIGSLCLGLPASPFMFAGGIVFGVFPGALYNWLATVIGSTLAFLEARYLGRDLVARLLRGRLVFMDEALGRSGFRAIFVMRLIPLVPFSLSNFAAGLTSVSLGSYVSATALSLAPGLIIVTYFAHSVWHGSTGDGGALSMGLASLLMLSLVLMPSILAWRRRRYAGPQA